MAASSQAAENRRLGYPSDEEAKVPRLQLRGLRNSGADRPPGPGSEEPRGLKTPGSAEPRGLKTPLSAEPRGLPAGISGAERLQDPRISRAARPPGQLSAELSGVLAPDQRSKETSQHRDQCDRGQRPNP
ncbi:hypothetical protein MDA_GLEAN10001152 [Myotis davidii]|uniref:Uncharacterized protein n=1 Tax=Myotis davidii TaxID=225400 RepID=L5MKB0_MYODS|nr:hypothetical protein MDA_GLEAN10001152 [Myotis davidii]